MEANIINVKKLGRYPLITPKLLLFNRCDLTRSSVVANLEISSSSFLRIFIKNKFSIIRSIPLIESLSA